MSNITEENKLADESVVTPAEIAVLFQGERRRAAKEKAYEYDAKSWFYTSSLAKSEAVMKTAFGRV